MQLPPAHRTAGVRHERADADEQQIPPLWWLLGAGGGVGVSTLSALWAPAGDTGRLWPGQAEESPYVLLVCRSTMQSMAQAADLLRQHHARQTPTHLQVMGVVVVPARPGRGLAKSVRRYRDSVLAELAGTVYSIPWHGELLDINDVDELPQWSPDQPITGRVRQVNTIEVSTDIAKVGHQIVADIGEHMQDLLAHSESPPATTDIPVTQSDTSTEDTTEGVLIS